MFDAAEAAFGPVDIVVNNAGIGGASAIAEQTMDAWDNMFAINVRGVFLGVQEAARRMQPRGSGIIINIASAAGKIARPYMACYCATKHAVIGITRSTAMELAPYGLRVNALCPGIVDTRLWREDLNPDLTELEGRENESAWDVRVAADPDRPLPSPFGRGERGLHAGQRRRVVHHWDFAERGWRDGAALTQTSLPMFATFVVGSLPRPVWVRELIERRKRGEVGAAAAERVLDDAVPAAIRMQEAAGLDFLSDGEWRRESYVKVFADAVAGFEPDLIAGGRGAAYPAVTSTLRQERPIALDEARFVQRTSTRRTLTAVPSPYTVARRMWSPEHSTAAYATREDFMEACIPIINGELKRLTSLGVDAIQLTTRGWRCWWIRSTGSGLGLTTSSA